MKSICLFSYDIKVTGIKIILNNIQKKLGAINLPIETDLEKALQYDVVLPYGILPCYDLLKRDKSKCTLALMVDAESLTNISKYRYLVGKTKTVPFKERYMDLLRYYFHTWQERKIFEAYDKIMLVSYYDKHYYEEKCGTKKNAHKIIVVPNGVNLPASPKKEHSTDGPFVLGFLSEWWSGDGDLTSERKSFLEYVWKEAYRENPNMKLLMCGRGMTERQKEYFKQYPNVEGIGEVESLNTFFDQIDASIIVNVKHAGILNKALDSFAYQCPVIGEPHNFWAFKDIPDCFYLYTDGKSLAESVKSIKENKEEVDKKIERAYKYIQEYHDWDKNYSVLCDEIEKLIV